MPKANQSRRNDPEIGRPAHVLAPFLDFAEHQGPDALMGYVAHCGIDSDAIADAGDLKQAILAHYRLTNGSYDIDAVAEDLRRWPPIMARIKELRSQANQRSSR